MSTYAIGDIQGCYQSFRKLLNKIKFDPKRDHLLLAGDMVNRGPDSLSTMEFVLEHQKSISCVLGNHDLHFLAVANHCQDANSKDTFEDILDSSSRDKIVSWLSQQPLAVYLKSFNTLVAHAGLPFNWSEKQAITYSNEVSRVLQSPACYQFYVSMYGNMPNEWNDKLAGVDRLRYITNAFTRMRYCDSTGKLELKVKSAPGKQDSRLVPWFELENNQYDGHIVFGHWASLQGQSPYSNIHAIDTGCVWGGDLTAVCLDDWKKFSVNSVEKLKHSL